MVTLIQNTALLLVLIVVFDLVTSRKSAHGDWQEHIMAAVILGGNCISLMPVSIRLKTGIIFDTLSVLLSLAELLFSSTPTSFAMNKVSAYPFGLPVREHRQGLGDPGDWRYRRFYEPPYYR